MPLLKLHTSVPVFKEKQDVLLSSLSSIIAEKIGKPTRYVMVAIEEGPVMMSGKSGNAAFVDVRSIGGLTSEVNNAITKGVCRVLKEYLGIPPDRVYIVFSNITAGNWGWDNRTFG